MRLGQAHSRSSLVRPSSAIASLQLHRRLLPRLSVGGGASVAAMPSADSPYRPVDRSDFVQIQIIGPRTMGCSRAAPSAIVACPQKGDTSGFSERKKRRAYDRFAPLRVNRQRLSQSIRPLLPLFAYSARVLCVIEQTTRQGCRLYR